MHNYEYRTGTNLLSLINYFKDYTYRSDRYDDREETPDGVQLVSGTYKSLDEAVEKAKNTSYWSGTTIAITVNVPGKVTKAYTNAFKSFWDKRKEAEKFEKELNIGYGRKSTKVTCPNCESSISLKYGSRHKCCPICGSTKIISDSNWKSLSTKKNMVLKSAEALSKEASKNNVTFVAAIGWHS